MRAWLFKQPRAQRTPQRGGTKWHPRRFQMGLPGAPSSCEKLRPSAVHRGRSPARSCKGTMSRDVALNPNKPTHRPDRSGAHALQAGNGPRERTFRGTDARGQRSRFRPLPGKGPKACPREAFAIFFMDVQIPRPALLAGNSSNNVTEPTMRSCLQER